MGARTEPPCQSLDGQLVQRFLTDGFVKIDGAVPAPEPFDAAVNSLVCMRRSTC
ncbi:hypothetical protein AB5J72_40300 [Streptomyces sp. CG1]|uniref:hypothetical protein n=1 Tax=Streptomyces sp. CG1 TaxID=1287523 RepID=UPI0034E276A4